MKWALSNVNRDDYMCEKDNPNSKNKNHTFTPYPLFRNTKLFKSLMMKKKLVFKETKRDQF